MRVCEERYAPLPSFSFSRTAFLSSMKDEKQYRAVLVNTLTRVVNTSLDETKPDIFARSRAPSREKAYAHVLLRRSGWVTIFPANVTRFLFPFRGNGYRGALQFRRISIIFVLESTVSTQLERVIPFISFFGRVMGAHDGVSLRGKFPAGGIRAS